MKDIRKNKITCLMIRNYIRYFKEWWDFREDRDLLENLILEKILTGDNPYGDIKEEDYEIYLDDLIVRGVIPKKEWLKKLIEINFNIVNKKDAKDIFDDGSKVEKGEKKGYSVFYIGKILKLIKYSENVEIKSYSENYKPIVFETDEMIIYLAPKILI
jgi:hypothetical protein